MTLLIAGVVLWWAAHFFKRVAPGARERMGDAGKGPVALAILASVVLMVLGYRAAEFIPVWEPPAFFTQVNNLLMVLVFYLFGVGATKGLGAARIRHPQLTAFKIWAIAHLLVNGDLASIILFGGLLGWAIISVIVINKAGPWTRPENTAFAGDAKALVIGLVLMGIVATIHVLVGPNPFGG